MLGAIHGSVMVRVIHGSVMVVVQHVIHGSGRCNTWQSDGSEIHAPHGSVTPGERPLAGL